MPLKLRAAMRKCKAARDHHRKVHRRLADKMGLVRAEDSVRMANLKAVTYEVHLPRLGVAYPPKGYWIYERPDTGALWHQRIVEDKMPDKRTKRLPMHQEDISQLAHIVPPDQGATIYDATSGEIAVVIIRDFCRDEDVKNWVGDVIVEDISKTRSVRLEDAGKLVCVGYTAGSRSKPTFDWARNLLSKKHPPTYINGLACRASSAAALNFNLVRGRLPDALTRDLDEYLVKNQFCRMDGQGTMAENGGSHGTYCIQKGNDSVEFHNVELAPPTAFMGANYARYVGNICTVLHIELVNSAMHTEYQPHRFAFSWTTNRNLKDDEGGNFYIASYGVKVCMAPNTFIAWCPQDVHGTSLMHRDPYCNTPPFAQWGISVATSSRLASIWKKYQDGIISAEEAERQWEESCEDDVIID
ncbi:uncharacterized protein B0H18DRAFT_882131 [Fomitopsis serialis]|uniref:uncharacterized protein n=1 Tax=Fomitopsis serialis TaxID=139415 RepID=UPI002007293E|nr:uncharacterized protein B0H18DRAFT_1197099 [Neoantrodia serialis]XP_047889401.1 uncharacterized protein B0H18DRAFT_882131 [Neoantrodia serialis]KAH9919230.1 hypothetical protein B0H18DRAFT_1197099 [Neoantrodia serialis]KAH9919243.1 hypothetical protein B0H18DRAFT_882131 [Neoantrodia serialis]